MEKETMTQPASIKDVADFFKIGDGTVSADPRNSLTAFSKEWKALSEDEKAAIRNGIGDKSYDY
jgi:hypothetical protein